MTTCWKISVLVGHQIQGNFIVHAENRAGAKHRLKQLPGYLTFIANLGLVNYELIVTRPDSLTYRYPEGLIKPT